MSGQPADMSEAVQKSPAEPGPTIPEDIDWERWTQQQEEARELLTAQEE